MNSSITLLRTVFLVFQILLYLVSHILAQPAFDARVCQDELGNYTTNSTFKQNLDKLLSTITSNMQIDYGFYNFSIGKNMDRVNGIALCRPDLLVADCISCLKDAAARIMEECRNQKNAIGWYQECMIRYSDRYIFGKMEFGPWYNMSSELYAIDVKGFNATASTLLRNLQKNASLSSDSRYKFADAIATISNSQNIYALVQCTPDLQQYDCYECLGQAIDLSLTKAYGKQARVFYTSCNIRYESYEFYSMTRLLEIKQSSLPPYVPLSPPSNSSTQGRKCEKLKIVIILVPSFTSLALLSIPVSLQTDFSTVKADFSN